VGCTQATETTLAALRVSVTSDLSRLVAEHSTMHSAALAKLDSALEAKLASASASSLAALESSVCSIEVKRGNADNKLAQASVSTACPPRTPSAVPMCMCRN
jgi:hypothetical protein